MYKLSAALLVGTLCFSHQAYAQSESDVIGWAGLSLTPVGAFTPVVSGASAVAKSTGLQLRVSHWQFDVDDDNTTNIGAGVRIARGRTRTTLELGYIARTQCNDCGIYMAGVDVQHDLASSTGDGPTLVATLNPALGFAKPAEGSGSVITVGLSLPVSASVDAGSQLRIVPFLSPGFGFSRVSGNDDSQTGSRAMLAGGVSLGSQTSPMLLSLGARKIFLDGTPTIYGIGLVVAR